MAEETENTETTEEPEAEVTSVEETTPAEAEGAAEIEEAVEATEEAPVEESAPASAPEEQKRPRKRLPRRLRHKHSKPKREASATRKPITRTARTEKAPGQRQERRGVVVSDKGDKTIVVSVDVTKLHPTYKKVVRRSRKFHAHDEQNQSGVGDVVRIVETRPLSKTNNWRLAEIVEKAK
ncbi:MAG: 30S ribosomal protein S17 [Actinobacteria bacterium]|nr:30S ribosomal protein S17 [Actinomycetota bacterium]